MAELILTEEEKKAISWLDMSDEALGMLCRKAVLEFPKILEDKEDTKRTWVVNAAMLLCNVASDANATKTVFTLNGLTHGNKKEGNWKVEITKVS